ncbi:copper amine oxidase N-terminal domain-containing protein [Paenibacillus pinisoli]|uniref:Copper amine oxidase N-terminal domain-containing protein n=1 Tax=Paenibacillus pinisoli TaxID=1276110 RepID=A0A3A6Q0C4_9BACL|nr:copper amine oxidase N-terminal domain-containing protein [Paenibacillus pinisoli]
MLVLWEIYPWRNVEVKKSVLVVLVVALTLIFPLNVFASVQIQRPVYVEGKRIAFDISPIVEKGTTLVQIRPLYEALGLTLSFDPKTREVKGGNDKYEVVLTLGSDLAKVNGKEHKLELAPRTIKGHTMVPLRFVAESVGNSVYVNTDTKRIFIGVFMTYLKDKYFDMSWGLSKEEVSKINKNDHNELLYENNKFLFYDTEFSLASKKNMVPANKIYSFEGNKLSGAIVKFNSSDDFDEQYSTYTQVIYDLNNLYRTSSIYPYDKYWIEGDSIERAYREVYKDDRMKMYEMAVRSGDLVFICPFDFADTELALFLQNKGTFSKPEYEVSIMYEQNKEFFNQISN